MSSTRHLLEKLQSACGTSVDRACIEVYFHSDELRGSIFSIGVVFQKGLSVKFGCAGDGSVSIFSGQCREFIPTVGDVVLVRELSQLAHSKLEECEALETILRLKLSNCVLEIRNVDDELEILLDNAPLNEEMLLQRE